jgi:hypothetical protein
MVHHLLQHHLHYSHALLHAFLTMFYDLHALALRIVLLTGHPLVLFLHRSV